MKNNFVWPLLAGILILVILIYIINYLVILNEVKKQTTENIVIENNTIDFGSLTLRQKIAQMIVVRGDSGNLDFVNLNIGGIFLDKQKKEEVYENLIKEYQGKSKIKLFAATDLEGAWSPFFKDNKTENEFPYFSEIKDEKQAYEIGFAHGVLLKKIGFNLNFAPVAEFKDSSYGGRAFSGSEEEIKLKLKNYIRGLQKNVDGICKHYPGKGMIRNLHWSRDKQVVSKEDLELFNACFENNISGVMMGHQIVSGEINSDGKPSSVSEKIISGIDNRFLIVSDEVNMFGLKLFYLFSKRKMYKDLINAGGNLILDFRLNPNSTYKLVLDLEKKVGTGDIDIDKVDASVKKILIAKGYKLKNG